MLKQSDWLESERILHTYHKAEKPLVGKYTIN